MRNKHMIEVYYSSKNKVKVLNLIIKMVKDLNIPYKIAKQQKKAQEEKYYLSFHDIDLKERRNDVEYYMFSGRNKWFG